MSGYAASGSGDSKNLDSLLAQLRQSKPINLEPSSGYGYIAPSSNPNPNVNPGYFGQASQPHQQFTGSPSYHPASVSSAIPTPQAYNTHPHHPSVIMSPAETPLGHGHGPPPARGGAPSGDRTSSLLNLLKFSNPSPASPRQPVPIGTPLPPSRETSMSFPRDDVVGHSAQDNGHSGSDLLAALMGGSLQSPQIPRASPQSTTSSKPTQFSSSAAPTSPPADTQNFLLSLLNKPKPVQSENQTHLSPSTNFKATKVDPSQETDAEVAEILQAVDAVEASALDLSPTGSATSDGNNVSAKENTPLSTNGKATSQETNSQGRFTYVNPFDQLAASSPRVRTPKNTAMGPTSSAPPAMQILKRGIEGSDNKRKNDELERGSTSSAGHTSSKRKLAASPQISSGLSTPIPNHQDESEALLGVDISGSKETVADALNELGDQVDKEVREAIARAERDENQATIKKEFDEMMTAQDNEEFEDSAQILAQHVRDELTKEENSSALDLLPTAQAEEVAAIVEAVANGHIADIDDGNVVDSWESADADAEDNPVKEEEVEVKVYNFPMRPWISITIKEIEGIPMFRESIHMDIARLKKEFDQVDRTLVTASAHYIVYGMSKAGGIRIIRQEDGQDCRLFNVTQDRVFNVDTCVSTTDLKESIIGTGVSGTVYWTMVKEGEGDHIEEGNLEMHGFALPPIHSLDVDSPGGGVLKTRARKSSSHPEFFAVGRGKYIHMIWPAIIMKSYLETGSKREAKAEKYLLENSFRVNTGKTGKDFVFSEDDTIIASLDKAGRVKFWDVRTLTKTDGRGHPSPEHKQPIEVSEPVCTFNTTPETEKSWPTSVLFVDKSRPYQRGGALRYVIVGMKQNHSLQLWDLGLQKAVQEIHLPHSKESDAICSVLYHAASGIIIVGHPTRNSIYFLHLSAPKYNLPKSLTQAEYMHKLIAKDPMITKPDSTAVISGVREYSFASRGSLRSLDILAAPSSNSTATPGEPAALFELYAMHSKGVTCLSVKQADLGWTIDNKVIHLVPAEKAGVITIENLKEAQVPVEEPVVSLPIRTTTRPSPKEIKETPRTSSTTAVPKVEDKQNAVTNGSAEKHGKRKSRKNTATQEAAASAPPLTQTSKPIVLDPNSHSRNGMVSKIPDAGIPTQSKHNSSFAGSNTNDAALKNVESRVTDEVKKLLKSSLDGLLQDIKADRRTQTAIAGSNHESLLRVVSTTLADNVEGTLSRIVTGSIQETVLPVISGVVAKTASDHSAEVSKLTSELAASIPRELHSALPHAISTSLQNPQLLKLMADSLARSVAFKVEEQFHVTMQKTVVPAFTKVTAQIAEKAAADLQRQANSQITALKHQQVSDNAKIEKLMQLVTGLTETVSTMAASQTEFQAQFLKLQEENATTTSKYKELARRSQSISSSAGKAVPDTKSEEDRLYQDQLDKVVRHMDNQNFSEATLAWLQSGDFAQQIFRDYFSRFRPEFIRDLNTIMLLSMGARICEQIEDEHMTPRVAYLDMIIQVLHSQIHDGTLQQEAIDHIPSIVATFIQRLEHIFMIISNINAADPGLKEVQRMVITTKRILEAVKALLAPSPPSNFSHSMRSLPSRHY